jgi:hypothetical protein
MSRDDPFAVVRCEGKIPYETRAGAQAVLRRIEKSHRLKKRGRGKAMPYLCCNCHKWHLGSVSAR